MINHSIIFMHDPCVCFNTWALFMKDTTEITVVSRVCSFS